jgi:Secretion system C-terminal sorting domain
MKRYNSQLVGCIIICLLSFNLAAQNPGGISTNLQFWIKADYTGTKMAFTSGKVSSWINEKSTFTLSNGTATQRPIRYDGSSTGSSVDSLNYQPHVTFIASTSNNLNNAATTPDLLGTAGTTFTVSNMDAGSKSAVTYLSNNVYRYQIKPNFRVQTSDGVAILSPLSTSPGYTSDFSSTYNSPRSNARITTSRGFAGTLTSRRNATPYTLTNSNVAPFCPGIGAGIFIGGNPTNSEYFDGKIAEVIFYNAVLTDADVQKVESSLAIKYGITLNPAGLDATNGYVSSAGTSVYSKGLTGTTYWNNIIGLGRDDNSGIYQRQSHVYDDSIRLYSSTLATTNATNTATITNSTFLVMGATTGKLMEDAATALEKPSGVNIRLDREWKLINTSYNQTFSIQIKPSSTASALFTGGGTIRLMADDDGNFINATLIPTGTSGVTIVYSSGIITITITPASSGGIFPVNGTPKYITVAANSGLLPNEKISLTAASKLNTVLLSWVSANETDIRSYELQKSTNQTDWLTIKTESAKGTTTNTTPYSFTDYEKNTKTVYYRVKQISANGNIEYSTIQEIKFIAKNLSIQLFPNPSTDYAKISWNGTENPSQIIVSNASGRQYKLPYSIKNNMAELNIINLPKGVYFISLIYSNQIIYSKLLKQ